MRLTQHIKKIVFVPLCLSIALLSGCSSTTMDVFAELAFNMMDSYVENSFSSSDQVNNGYKGSAGYNSQRNQQKEEKEVNAYSNKGVWYHNKGKNTFATDGNAYRTEGDYTFGSNGKIYYQKGNSIFGSDGNAYQKKGDYLFGTDGSITYIAK